MSRHLLPVGLIFGLCLSPFAAFAEETAKKNIVETAVAAGSFKTLVKAIQAAGLVEVLQGSGPFTVGFDELEARP